MSLLSKIRALRGETTNGGATAKENKKSPVYERIEQQKLLRRIDETLGENYSLFWRVSVATGARTSDVCRMSFNDVDLSTGIWSYTVSKQTKAAEARSYNKTLKIWKEQLKRAAMLNGDQRLYMQIDCTNYADIADHVPAEQLPQLEADLTEAVNNAPVKRDSKKLPAKVLEIIKQRKERNHHDNYVFSRSLTNSNRSINQEGCITRQTIYAALRSVFDWFKDNVNGALKLSPYSSRKTFAYRMLRGVSGKENNIAETMAAFSHSSISMTMKYLGLASKAEELQTALSEI